jgi:hypothetical protein
MNVLSVFRTAAIVLTALVVLACGAAGGTGAAPGTGASGAPVPSAVAPQDQDPAPTDENPILVDPMPGGHGELTLPQPGQLDVHPVTAESLEAAVNGRQVTIKVSWTSGVEPCYVLDSIRVDEADRAFAITVNEGHGPGDNVCIEIAKSKFALVDLGELEPGTYTISDGAGGAAPIEVTVG